MTMTVSPLDPLAVAARIATDRPMFHLADRTTSYAQPGDQVIWNALPETLGFIARTVRSGDLTLEIGAGASTVVFAAAGARHTAISPQPHEHARIAEYCDSLGVSTGDVSFIESSSDAVVPGLDIEPLGLVLIDGTHAFPYAIVEWHYLRRLIRPGGILLLDDVPIPAVAPVYRYMRSHPDWELLDHLDRRTAAFRKLRDTPEQTWREQPLNRRYPDYGYLPLGERARAHARHGTRRLRATVAARIPAVRRLREVRRREPSRDGR